MIKTVKKAAAMLCCAAMAAFMTGCMNIGIGVDVRSDGTAAMTARYAIQNDYYSEDMFEDTEYEIKSFNIDGTDYTGYEIVSDYVSYDELTAQMTTLSEDGTKLFESASIVKGGNPFVKTYKFDAVVSNLMGEDDESGDYAAMAASMLKVDFTLKLPGEVKSCTGGVVTEDGTIRFAVDPSAETVCSAESSEVNLPLIIGAAVVAIAIIAVIAVSSASKKKKIGDDGFTM